MIDRLLFRFGAAAGRPPLEVPATPVTVFVGPNNAGKSKVLVELERYCRNVQPNATDVIVDRVIFSQLSREEIVADID